MALLISLHDDAATATKVYAFEKSPVRLGRNPLNDLTVDHSFVSQWHALLRFEGRTVTLIDLGSTNGTAINGTRLPAQTSVSVGGPSDEIQLGALKITIAFGPASAATEQPPRSTFEGLGSATALDAKAGRTAVLEPGGAGQTSPAVVLQMVSGAMEDTKPQYAAYRAAAEAALDGLRRVLTPMPDDVRPAAVRTLMRAMPELMAEPALGPLLTEFGVDPREYQMPEPREWLVRLAGRPDSMKSQVHVGVAMERVGALLEAFSESYVELRKGMEQFGAEMGLQLTSSASVLQQAQSREDVLSYLLDWVGDGNQRVDDLRRSFADVALHQVAMLNGVMAGGRELLQEVGPERVVKPEGDALAVKLPLFARIFSFGSGAKWARYKATHKRLQEEDRFARVLFGRQFMRAYYTVAGSNPEGDA